MHWMWIVFAVGASGLLAADLGVFGRHEHTVGTKEAALKSLAWLLVAMLFCGGVYLARGERSAVEFATGYVIELSLSADNVFLFAVLFSYFGVPAAYQHRVLLWGILSAVVMRGALIALGVALLARFHWVFYVFGVFLLFTGIKMLLHRDKTADFSENAVARWLVATGRVVDRFEGARFLVRVDGRVYATRLLVVLILVELTDILFALDSIPAVFAVTRDPFVVFTSNVFAILGLRSLYFLLAGMMGRFRFLSTGLAVILVFVGAKMLGIVRPSVGVSLGVIIVVLSVAVVASMWTTRCQDEAA